MYVHLMVLWCPGVAERVTEKELREREREISFLLPTGGESADPPPSFLANTKTSRVLVNLPDEALGDSRYSPCLDR